MAHREFTDANGTHWQAWAVIPSSAERRRAGERRFGSRARRDRRQREELRVHMDDALTRGWLVFESDHEKRRLLPIPPGWEQRTDDELTKLCETATVAPPPRLSE